MNMNISKDIRKIVVFGLGAIGSNLLMQLVKVYPGIEYYGIDYDKVEERNIATQAYVLPQVGLFKALAMQVIIGWNIRNVKYVGFVEKLQESGIDNIPYKGWSNQDIIIIDCFDNAESRKLLEGYDNCLHIGFSPTYTAEIIWGKSYTSPKDIVKEENDICELTYAVPFINFVVSLGMMSISDFLENKNKNSFIITNKMIVKKL